jgi:hypothetical protein
VGQYALGNYYSKLPGGKPLRVSHERVRSHIFCMIPIVLIDTELQSVKKEASMIRWNRQWLHDSKSVKRRRR